MSSYPSDITLEVCANGLLGFIGLLFLFALNRDGIPAGFRLAPVSTREWIIFYFHTLEALTLTGLYVCGIGRGYYVSWAFPVTVVFFGLVFLSSLVAWRWDRDLCYRGLFFCVFAFLLVLLSFPALAASKEA